MYIEKINITIWWIRITIRLCWYTTTKYLIRNDTGLMGTHQESCVNLNIKTIVNYSKTWFLRIPHWYFQVQIYPSLLCTVTSSTVTMRCRAVQHLYFAFYNHSLIVQRCWHNSEGITWQQYTNWAGHIIIHFGIN